MSYVRKELRLTRQELLWGAPWVTILLEMADNPSVRQGEVSPIVTDELDVALLDEINNTII
ncbi:hypothetical protein IX308_000447 [Porphyromonas levii]|nr:hypothetical protein [Porphyromonas levii]